MAAYSAATFRLGLNRLRSAPSMVKVSPTANLSTRLSSAQPQPVSYDTFPPERARERRAIRAENESEPGAAGHAKYSPSYSSAKPETPTREGDTSISLSFPLARTSKSPPSAVNAKSRPLLYMRCETGDGSKTK